MKMRILRMEYKGTFNKKQNRPILGIESINRRMNLIRKLTLLLKYNPRPVYFLYKYIKRKTFGKHSNYFPRRKAIFLDSRRIDSDNNIKFTSSVDISQLDVSGLDNNILKYLCSMYCNHRYDILGTGWTCWNYHSGDGSQKYPASDYTWKSTHDASESYIKLEDHLSIQFLMKSKKILENIDGEYSPIDWQLDPKSSFRWCAKKWSKDNLIQPSSVADIKLPWELSRFHHLVQLSIFSLRLQELRLILLKEFKNQILDFIATNPTSCGVNWACTMDIAIRAVNILVAYDVFKQIDKEDILDETFRKILFNSLVEHGRFIYHNLELEEVRPNNHYLADIAGLVFISVYLSGNKEIGTWRKFALYSFIDEVKKQVNEDGSNFEYSTSYHRLSGEMIVYTSALILGNPDRLLWVGQAKQVNLLPDWFAETIRKMVVFTMDCTKPSGDIIQVGDSDSGRFLRLTPVGNLAKTNEIKANYINLNQYQEDDEHFWVENSLDHRAFVSAGMSLLSYQSNEIKPYLPLEYSFIKCLSKGECFRKNIQETQPSRAAVTPRIKKERLKYTRRIILTYKQMIPAFDSNPLVCKIYGDIGIIIFRNDSLFLSIVSGPLYNKKYGGHAHDDFGSFDLYSGSVEYVRDPGSYLYTSDMEKRNLFRSRFAHCGLYSKNMPAIFWRGGMQGLFEFIDSSDYGINSASANSVEVFRIYKGITLLRSFQIEKTKLVVDDYSNSPIVDNASFPYFSPGYGIVEVNRLITKLPPPIGSKTL